jgi:hypothetical protein
MTPGVLNLEPISAKADGLRAERERGASFIVFHSQAL